MSSSIYQLWIVKFDKLPHVFINILQPYIYIYICIYIFLITGQKLLLNSVELNTRKVDNHIDNLHSRPIQIHWTIDHSNKLLLLTSTLCPLQCDNVLFIYLLFWRNDVIYVLQKIFQNWPTALIKHCYMHLHPRISNIAITICNEVGSLSSTLDYKAVWLCCPL